MAPVVQARISPESTMHKLIAELMRLYLPADVLPSDILALPVSLTGGDGQTRAMMIPFRKTKGADSEAHWTRLCEVANALQTTLKLPAPAVSISGGDAYYLWLSLATPVPAERAQAFLERLRDAYFARRSPCHPACTRAPASGPPSSTRAWARHLPTNRAWTCSRRRTGSPGSWKGWRVSMRSNSSMHGACSNRLR
jgi:hypothetical protein